jgi:hypothetical protein
MPRRTIACLANSWKLGASCVAGVDLETNEWIRPLGSGSHGAVTEREQRLDDGTRPALLDVIEIPLLGPAAEVGHPENWQLEGGVWRRVGRLGDAEARPLLEALVVDAPVFGSNARGFSVEEIARGDVANSLAIVRPQELVWRKEIRFGRARIRAIFEHGGASQDLGVTDPEWVHEFTDDDLGEFEHDSAEDVYLVISLAEPLNDVHYKLVAGVICL